MKFNFSYHRIILSLLSIFKYKKFSKKNKLFFKNIYFPSIYMSSVINQPYNQENILPYYLNSYKEGIIGIIFLFIFLILLLINNTKVNKIKDKLTIEKNFTENIINTANTIIITLDSNGKILSFNQHAEKITGYQSEEIINKNIYKTLIHKDYRSKALQTFHENYNHEQIKDNEVLIICKNEQQKLISWNVSPIKNQNKGLNNTLIIGVDITKNKRAEEALKYQAFHDNLTGLPNREFFNKQLLHEAEIAKNNHKGFAVFFLDLDRFKLINDMYGHQTGDLILLELSNRLISTLPNRYTIARMGGDEFIGILPGITKAKLQIPRIINHLIKIFDDPFVINDHDFVLTASIGISIYPEDGLDEETLLKNADTAMYKAKEDAGTSFQLYNHNMNLQVNEKIFMENNLRRAIENQELTVYYQPIIDIKTGKIKKAEALVRWEHPEEGIISPAKFIPLAEETGLIIPLGSFVLKEACQQLQDWINMGYHPIEISVNLSAQQFHKSNLKETVDNILDETGLNPELLGLEITESIAIQNVESTISVLNEFKNMKVKILLDDFGTGYSSLSYLVKFAVDIIKIDRSFITNFPNHSKRSAIVSAIIAMANKLTMKTVAEGVESWDEIKCLNEYKCDEAQGYLFSKPIPAKEFENLLKNNIEFKMHA
ncbi:sensor domain-containing protein [Orenia marismortui]|uniref:sensor domain-containing protein n=1 Tax=Orenia marismortui TaxID=46469 RepID=UPI00037E3B83|nr:EAL domain-containing protein [Orenia marismortui]